jgi:hypothetical protein
MSENRRLRSAHLTVIEQIEQLSNIDLLRQRQKWKDKLNEIRRSIDIIASERDPE